MSEQSKFILTIEQYPGFFVDIGAYDGITGSNTKALEDNGWSGICIEPNPNAFNKLKQCRQCECLNIAISNVDNDHEQFIIVEGYAEQISCILKDTPQEHLERIKYDLRDGKQTLSTVKSRKFSTIITQKEITYLSIDAETHELNILYSINFDYHNIKYISFEKNNYDKNNCGEFLKTKGYKFLTTIGVDHFYVK